MSRFLMVDIGAGTMDILCFDDESGLHFKAVAKSPVLHLAENAAKLSGNILITGCEMGGGSISQVLRKHAESAQVYMTASAAMTVHHDPDRVRSWGIKVVGDTEAEHLKRSRQCSTFAVGDVDIKRLESIIEGLGVPFAFDVVGICAQDHGMPPKGVSHLDYRHNIFKQHLDESASPDAMLYGGDDVPETFNRLRSIAQSARRLPTNEVYVMDSGMAAILGASMDLHARRNKRVMVLDIATSHTVAAALEEGQIAGFFEYHTHDVTLDRLMELLRDLADGRLEHPRILEEGGHGAYMRKAIGFETVEAIVATGPKRRLLERARLPIVFGAPWGDNMMTGTVGLLEAIRRRKKLKQFVE
jgi:uncharacterized protein (DUF1786 family)